MYYVLIALCAAIAMTDLWIVGGKSAATIVICFFAYAIAYKSAREQKMIAVMSAVAIVLRKAVSAVDAEPQRLEDN